MRISERVYMDATTTRRDFITTSLAAFAAMAVGEGSVLSREGTQVSALPHSPLSFSGSDTLHPSVHGYEYSQTFLKELTTAIFSVPAVGVDWWATKSLDQRAPGSDVVDARRIVVNAFCDLKLPLSEFGAVTGAVHSLAARQLSLGNSPAVSNGISSAEIDSAAVYSPVNLRPVNKFDVEGDLGEQYVRQSANAALDRINNFLSRPSVAALKTASDSLSRDSDVSFKALQSISLTYHLGDSQDARVGSEKSAAFKLLSLVLSTKLISETSRQVKTENPLATHAEGRLLDAFLRRFLNEVGTGELG